jgi:mannose-6-phosphate isomerase-like protein (cupin superfamily)
MRRLLALLGVMALGAGIVLADEAPPDPQLQAVGMLMEHLQPKLHRCWEAAAADNFRVHGKIVVRLTAGKGGKVAKVEVVSDDTGDAELSACVVGLAKALEMGAAFAPGDGLELPFAFVASAAQYTVREADVTVRAPKGGKLEARLLLDKDSVDAELASLTVLSLKRDTAIPLHRQTSAKIYYVLEGSLRITGLGKALGEGKGVEAGPGDAVYVPAGTAAGVLATCCKNRPTRLLVLYAPGGPERPFKDPAAAKAGTTTAVSKAEQKKPDEAAPQPKVVKAADVKDLAVMAGKGKVKILFDAESAGDGAAYVGWLRAEAGGAAPEHVHDKQAELLYVLEGSGSMTIDGVELPVEAGMGVYIPPSKKHSFKTSAGLTAVQFYTPSGPEQRFKQAPAPTGKGGK